MSVKCPLLYHIICDMTRWMNSSNLIILYLYTTLHVQDRKPCKLFIYIMFLFISCQKFVQENKKSWCYLKTYFDSFYEHNFLLTKQTYHLIFSVKTRKCTKIDV